MLKHAIAGFAATLALSACGGGGTRSLSYAPSQPATAPELAAADQAEAVMGVGHTYTQSEDPMAGGPGLADQMATGLGGQSLATVEGASAASATLLRSLPEATPAQARQALGDTLARPGAATAVSSFLDPTCVAPTVGPSAGSVVWSGCTLSVQVVDMFTGGTIDVTAQIDGRLDWNVTTGVTSWNITMSIDFVLMNGSDPIPTSVVTGLTGTLTDKAGTIKGSTASTVTSTFTVGLQRVTAALRTSLVVDLAYLADPFCITTGTLTLEQVWTRLPPGASAVDQGWKFSWTGDGVSCGQVLVAHGQ